MDSRKPYSDGARFKQSPQFGCKTYNLQGSFNILKLCLLQLRSLALILTIFFKFAEINILYSHVYLLVKFQGHHLRSKRPHTHTRTHIYMYRGQS